MAYSAFAGTFLISIWRHIWRYRLAFYQLFIASEYASKSNRRCLPALEILAGVVVYGFFAALTIAPLFKGLANYCSSITVASESAGVYFVMGIMIISYLLSF